MGEIAQVRYCTGDTPMSAEVSFNLSRLQQLVDEVQRTKQAQTIRLADGVVAVVKPEPKPTARQAKRRRTSASLSPMSIEDVYGAVTTPAHLRGRDIDEMIRDAKDERAERFFKQ